jgi:hypothetical protein
MKTNRTNNQNKIRNNEINSDFNFSWIFSGNGQVFQSHDENEYKRFCDLNYISVSNQDL